MADNNRVKEQLREITERLEQGIQEVFESEKYKEYLNTMSKFYNYSFNNTMLIAMQKPDATLVAGYQAWQKKFERHVKLGEKGIRIIAPAPITQKEQLEKLDPVTQEPLLDERGKPMTEEVETRVPTFKVISVFDVSQTEGKELPDLAVDELPGTVENYELFMQALTAVAPVPIGYEAISDGAKGYYHLEEKRIALQEGMSEIQNTKTAIHEIAHAMLHDIDLNDPKHGEQKDRKTKEVEAESIAYAVSQHYGIDTSDYSFGYVAGWSSDKKLKELKSSLETIRKASATLINAIDEKMAKLQLTKEELLLNAKEDSFGIYQLKRGEELLYHRFEGLDSLSRHGLSVEKDNYELIYSAPLQEGQTLDDIFEQFNLLHPEDFTGHSLSVSDIVLLHKEGVNTAHYVDRIGFQEVFDFLEKEKEIKPEIRKADELAFQMDDRYLSIQTVESGYDYTFYNEDYQEWDGGVYDNPDITISEAAKEILAGEGFTMADCSIISYEELQENVEQVAQADLRKIRERSMKRESALTEEQAGVLWKIANESGMNCWFSIGEDHSYIYDLEENQYMTLGEGIQVLSEGMTMYEDYHMSAEEITLFQELLSERGIQQKQLGNTFLSNTTEPDTAIKVEETVLAYTQTKAEEYGYEVQVLAAKVYGSRVGGAERPDSDLDVLIEYKGDIREDDFFSMLHEDRLSIGGMLLDINPITADKSGTIEEYLARANEYLEEKRKGAREITSDKEQVEVFTQEPMQTLTFYVAECMEFTTLGEYHENLALKEAIRLYEAIPAERINGSKGIGFTLHKAADEAYKDSTMAILDGNTIDVDTINHMDEFQNNPLIQEAVKEVIQRFPDAEVWDRDTKARERQEVNEELRQDCMSLSVEIDQFCEDYDTYEYKDSVDSKEENIEHIYDSLYAGDSNLVKEWLQSVIDEEEPAEEIVRAKGILKKVNDLVERREENPLTKVEELEEANYNQIDGILNNLKPKEEEQTEASLSIMERLKRNQEKIENENLKGKSEKESEKRPERGME